MRSEVVTLQIGSYANFTGAHFWNAQDEAAGLAETQDTQGGDYSALDAGVLYRQVNGTGGSSYTPRLVLFDWEAALGGVATQPDSLARRHTLSTADSTVATWNGAASVIRAEPVEKSAFYRALEAQDEGEEEFSVARLSVSQKQAGGELCDAAGGKAALSLEEAAAALEGGVRFWTDMCKAQFHPRSFVPMRAAWGIDTPDGYGATQDYTTGAAADDAHDRIRYFAEECDSLAGFHIIAHDCGAFGALTESVVTHLNDTFPGLPLLVYSVRSPAEHGTDEDPGAPRRRALTEALALWKCGTAARVYAPLGRERPSQAWSGTCSVDDAQLFHTAAPLAVAIDTATLAWRLARHHDAGSGACELWEAMEGWTGGTARRPLVATSLAMPASPLRRPHAVHGRGGPAAGTTAAMPAAQLDSGWVSLTEGIAASPEAPTYESYAVRGLRFEDDNTRADVTSVQLAMHQWLRTAGGVRCPRALSCSTAPVPLPLSFPRIMHRAPMTTPRPANPPDVAVVSRTAATEDFGPVLKRQADRFKTMCATAPARALFSAWGLSTTDADEAGESLATLAQNYTDAYSSGDDE